MTRFGETADNRAKAHRSLPPPQFEGFRTVSSGSGTGRLIVLAAVAAWFAAIGPVPSAHAMGCHAEEHLAIPLGLVVADPGEDTPSSTTTPDLGRAPCSSRLPAPAPIPPLAPSADLIAAAVGEGDPAPPSSRYPCTEPPVRPRRSSRPLERPPR